MTDDTPPPPDDTPPTPSPDPDPVVRTGELQGFVRAVVDAQQKVLGQVIGQERARADARMEELDRNVIEYVQDVVAQMVDAINALGVEVDALKAGAGDGAGDGGVDADPEEERERYRTWVTVEAARVGVKPSDIAKMAAALKGDG